MRTLFLLTFLTIYSNFIYPQTCSTPYRIVVLGSSTAAGMGATPNHSWVYLYTQYLKGINTGYQVYNLAVGGYTTYDINPTGYVPPPDRPSPDTAHNITKALSLQPDAIIINLPTNDVGRGYTIAEQQANYQRVISLATAQNVKVWVCSTQPRNDYSAQMVANLKTMRDWTFSYFGDKSIDFWTGMNQPNDSIKWAYSYGDGIHFNDSGHYVLYTRAVARNIPQALCNGNPPPPTVPVVLNSFTVTNSTNKLQLNWSTAYEKNVKRFLVQRSTDSVNFSALATVTATGNDSTARSYTYLDTVLRKVKQLYRLDVIVADTHYIYSSIKSGIPDTAYGANTYFNITNLQVQPNKDKLQILWYSNNEKSTKQFIIEHSSDSLHWNTVGTLAAAGNYSGSRFYNFTDTTTYYRLQYYRLNMVTTTNLHFFSAVVKGMPDTMYTQPFRIATFTVTLQQSKAQLNWTTSAEKNTMNFSIERSRDTLTWLAIGTVNAAGNSTTTRSYSFRDTATQTGTVYYRLNMLTHDNRRFFSKVVKFTFPAARIKSSPQAPVVSDAKDGLLLAPNPIQESTQLLGLSPGNHAVRIFDFSGREIYFNPQFQQGKKIDAHHWTRGVYIVVVDEGKYRLKVVKQ
ncbi:GDSL-type esterase/lipase family protein [Chitinophaga ginsengisoli]|uniref:Putative secreted protein (Por secretion system target) n=1 Tax=Chitinophaga ginsengisoli TaxID=363837 RepID=A0A2P8FVW7_9BACT|nr:GDSL-type esterase/lipase family protein [Chitinophaga ginsengisoli]PSL25856.1 putative secreted protein (Por secretion system target) [Chitinophaga ginsengisoli]